MSKVIYSLKVWVFSDQFKLFKKGRYGYERFYLKAWITATDGVLASASDMAGLQQLTAFEEHDNEVS